MIGSTFGSIGSIHGGTNMREAVRALLVHVVDDLRMPDVVQLRDRQRVSGWREDVPVAIVIVPDVLLIQLRRAGTFVRRAERFRYQSRTMSTPSGFSDGTSKKDRVLRGWPETSACLPSAACRRTRSRSCVEATSVEWIEQVIRTTVLPSRISFSASRFGRRAWIGEPRLDSR